jgi:hypothetical protein
MEIKTTRQRHERHIRGDKTCSYYNKKWVSVDSLLPQLKKIKMNYHGKLLLRDLIKELEQNGTE